MKLLHGRDLLLASPRIDSVRNSFFRASLINICLYIYSFNSQQNSCPYSNFSFVGEMDWDGNGKISFREFLFAFIHWVGIDADEEPHPQEN